ncbi:hypothetical protein [Streptomyces sp. S.PNR 29]|uniref:hypothetical protein n=1 Tax=Streptomyces sp. S.PNR 29 TaxID=2973805 RepID=UPI0025AF1CE6|nr:hypothetical protein [Streptomyces sp. S.PNR 29]MDN0200670.1 hypothetical protein [Streptomyces sp. S.PNR 29]
MSRPGGDGPHGDRAGPLVNEIEGYLMARAHHDDARREAADLCARMPWLTAAQAEDLTSHYVRQRIDLTRQMLLATVARAAELRQEYENRYAELRRDLLRRHAACACAVLVGATGLSTLPCLLSR